MRVLLENIIIWISHFNVGDRQLRRSNDFSQITSDKMRGIPDLLVVLHAQISYYPLVLAKVHPLFLENQY